MKVRPDDLPRIRRIMEVADHPNCVLCWNCNRDDLAGALIEESVRPDDVVAALQENRPLWDKLAAAG